MSIENTEPKSLPSSLGAERPNKLQKHLTPGRIAVITVVLGGLLFAAANWLYLDKHPITPPTQQND
jgi:hypothetical protein